MAGGLDGAGLAERAGLGCCGWIFEFGAGGSWRARKVLRLEPDLSLERWYVLGIGLGWGLGCRAGLGTTGRAFVGKTGFMFWFSWKDFGLGAGGGAGAGAGAAAIARSKALKSSDLTSRIRAANRFCELFKVRA